MRSLEEHHKEILCLDPQKPVQVLKQQHLSVLSFIGVISTPFYLRCCRIDCTKWPGMHYVTYIGNTYILPTDATVLEQIFIVSGSDKKLQPKALATFMIEHDWVLKVLTPFLERGSFIWESSSLAQWRRRNVRSCGPFGPIETVKGVEIHKPTASTLLYPSTQGHGDTNSDQLGPRWFSCGEPE